MVFRDASTLKKITFFHYAQLFIGVSAPSNGPLGWSSPPDLNPQVSNHTPQEGGENAMFEVLQTFFVKVFCSGKFGTF